MSRRKQLPYPRCKYCIYIKWNSIEKENRCVLHGGKPTTCNTLACLEFVHRQHKEKEDAKKED